MRVLYSPCRSDLRIAYTFEGDTVKAVYKGKTDLWDFNEVKDGDKVSDFTSSLEVCPIEEVYRQDGVLHVKLLQFHGPNPSHEEAFPDWQEV